AHVACMHADARLVEHEQRVDERRAERGSQIDALHLAARQRAGLAVERQIAEADLVEVAETGQDLVEDELRRGIQRSRCLTPFVLSGKWCLSPFSALGVEARGAPLRKRCLTSFSAPFS